MFRHALGLSLAGALTLTSFAATPAQADLDRGETMRLLLGLGAVAIIASEAERRKDKRTKVIRKRPVAEPQPTYRPVQPRRPAGHMSQERLKGEIFRGAQARTGQRRYLPIVPAECERRIQAYNGKVRRVFGRPCLKRAGFRQPLPRQCQVTVDLPNRSVTAWKKRCLINAGYDIR